MIYKFLHWIEEFRLPELECRPLLPLLPASQELRKKRSTFRVDFSIAIGIWLFAIYVIIWENFAENLYDLRVIIVIIDSNILCVTCVQPLIHIGEYYVYLAHIRAIW